MLLTFIYFNSVDVVAMKLPFFIVDAFTIPEVPFSGNQAAIVVLDTDDQLSDGMKQRIAAELNLSETAFVSKSWTSPTTKSTQLKDDGHHVERTLRWFTPTNEVDLCGHATLATARVVFDTLKDVSEVTFDTKFKGKLIAELDPSNGQISLDFPSAPPVAINSEQFPALDELLEALFERLNYKECIKSINYSVDTKKLLIEIFHEKEEQFLRQITPNFSKLLAIKGNENFVKGIIVTMEATSVSDDVRADFKSRYFAPWNGINEDPVTGSAHTVLAPFWQPIKMKKKDSRTLIGQQCSKRGGVLICSLTDDGRVRLAGSTKVVVEGNISV